MSKALLFVALLSLSGCEMPERYALNQCKRREIFAMCLAKVPPGPAVTTYNDWSEVIDSCDDSARKQSYALPSNIPKRCL